MRGINVLLAILVSVFLGLAVFEGGLRLLPQFRPTDQINEFDSTLGWSKKPDYTAERSTAEFDVTFEINSQGLRDDAMESTAKEPNTFRVMALGDSFVLGFTVDREDLFVDQLENWWVAENRRVDVINAGTEGYSTDQEVAWFLEHGVDYEPDLVLIFPYENDIYWNGQATYTRYPKPRFAPDGKRETGTLADPGPGSALMRFATGKALGMLSGALRGGPVSGPHQLEVEGLDSPLYAEFAPLLVDTPAVVDDCLARTKGALTALRNRCAGLGMRLVMVPIPSESVVHAKQRENFKQQSGLGALADERWDPNLPVEHFLGMADELGIEALDPREHLIAAGAKKSLYFDAEWHFNPLGNEVFARYLHGELDRLEVFPANHGATKQADLVLAAGAGGLPTWLVVYLVLLLILGTGFKMTYKDEPFATSYLKVAGLLAMVFAIIIGGGKLLGVLPPVVGQVIGITVVLVILGFVAYKLGRRLATILELLRSFTLRGHWYLMPLVVVLLTIGSLLVVAASSPLVAPFIYTLF